MKKHLTTIIILCALCVGVGLLLYPTVSDYWNARHQSDVISSYLEEVAQMDDDRYASIWEEARAYNARLAEEGNTWILTEAQKEEYERQLDVSASGAISYVDIPAINCQLPVYHGTGDAVLQVAIGHIEGSSLPTGGESTHCVLSGHRGLPSAQLFSKLDQLVVGDVFYLQTLDETLTYEVDQILIVLPHETEALEIQKGRDLCTLVTCTPYGINSHRLLVRGHRVENRGEEKAPLRVTADAMQIEPLVVAPTIAVPMLVVFLIAVMATTRKKRKE